MVMIALLVLHVLAAAFWFGSTVLLVAVVSPALAAAGVEAAAPVGARLFRRIPIALGIAGGTTVLSGLILYWVVSNGLNGAFVHSTGGITIGIGALCGIGAVASGIVTGRLGPRGSGFARISVALLLCSLTLMIVGPRV